MFLVILGYYEVLNTDNMWNIISSCYSIGISTDRREFQL